MTKQDEAMKKDPGKLFTVVDKEHEQSIAACKVFERVPLEEKN